MHLSYIEPNSICSFNFVFVFRFPFIDVEFDLALTLTYNAVERGIPL